MVNEEEWKKDKDIGDGVGVGVVAVFFLSQSPFDSSQIHIKTEQLWPIQRFQYQDPLF